MSRYYGTAAYDIERFEAPERKAPTQKEKAEAAKPLPKHRSKTAVKGAKLVKIVSLIFQNAATRSVAVVLGSALVVASIMLYIGCIVKYDTAVREVNSLTRLVQHEETDKIRLEMAVNEIASIDRVEFYAENVLGMVKLTDAKYVKQERSDAVVLSGGKTVSSSEPQPSMLTAFLQFFGFDSQSADG